MVNAWAVMPMQSDFKPSTITQVASLLLHVLSYESSLRPFPGLYGYTQTPFF